MKITFSNLGSIKKTTLDLRPLTVIIGPNNSNKTYIAYSIYGLFQSMKENLGDFLYNLEFGKVSKTHLDIKIDDDFYNGYISNFEKIISEFTNNLSSFYQDSSGKLFTKTNFKIPIYKKTIKSAFEKVLKKKLVTHKFDFKDQILTVYFDKPALKNDEVRFKRSEVLADLIVSMRWQLFSDSFVLPAERNALITIYRKLINRRYKELKTRQEQNESNYPRPVEDFLDFLIEVGVEKNLTNIEKFNEIALKIEIDIQKKNKTNLDTNSGEIKINVKKNLDIDLYNASSSIKQLVPLILYLRYEAITGDLLIIDEPEMNLHPESQAKLLEVLGMLVNAGVNVLLTTHSPYFMSHLNNLVSGKTDDESVLKEQAKSLYLGDERAFLKPEDVSAYEMKNNKLKDLKDKDYGIRWDTLSDVSADIQQKYFEIYEKGDTPTNGEKE